RANHEFKRILFRDLEDLFYKKLKKDREWDNNNWPFFVRVGDVEEHTLKDATFKHRVPGHPVDFDLTVQAKRADVRFDDKEHKAIVQLTDADIRGGTGHEFVTIID